MADSNSTRFVTIYTLNDPETNEVRYVGQTKLSLNRRLKGHLKEKNNTYKCNWVNSLQLRGLNPVINPIEEGIEEDWAEREKFWICYYRELGARLTNLSDGGESAPGFAPSDETREKLRKTTTKLWTDPEFRAKQSLIMNSQSYKDRSSLNLKKLWGTDEFKLKMQALHDDPEYKAKISAVSSGRKKSPEELIKISEKSKAAWKDSAYRERQRIIQTGKKPTAEQRAKQSAAQIGMKRSIETRARQSAAAKARFSNPEVREKHRASMKAAYSTPEAKAKLSKQTAALWENPEYRLKVITAITGKTG